MFKWFSSFVDTFCDEFLIYCSRHFSREMKKIDICPIHAKNVHLQIEMFPVFAYLSILYFSSCISSIKVRKNVYIFLSSLILLFSTIVATWVMKRLNKKLKRIMKPNILTDFFLSFSGKINIFWTALRNSGARSQFCQIYARLKSGRFHPKNGKTLARYRKRVFHNKQVCGTFGETLVVDQKARNWYAE